MYPAACPRCPITPPSLAIKSIWTREIWCWERTPASSPDTPTSAWRRYPGWPPPLVELPFLHTSTCPSFSLLGVLGLWMPELGFPLAEVSRQCPPEFRLRPDLAGLRLITNSDAHYLDQVWEAEHTMELPERTAAAVLYWLQGTR